MFGIPVGLLIKIGIALAIAAVLYGLWYSADHWCNTACHDQTIIAEATQKAYNEAVVTAQTKNMKLEANNEILTAKYADAAKKYALVSVEARNNAIEITKKDKELNSIKLSNRVVRMFNDEPTNTSGANGQGITIPKQLHDGTTGTVGETGTQEGSSRDTEEASDFDLGDLYAVYKRNEGRYGRCVEKLRSWQTFWPEYVKGVAAATQ